MPSLSWLSKMINLNRWGVLFYHHQETYFEISFQKIFIVWISSRVFEFMMSFHTHTYQLHGRSSWDLIQRNRMESEYHQTEAIWMFFMVCLISDLVNTSRLVHFYLIKKKKKSYAIQLARRKKRGKTQTLTTWWFWCISLLFEDLVYYYYYYHYYYSTSTCICSKICSRIGMIRSIE